MTFGEIKNKHERKVVGAALLLSVTPAFVLYGGCGAKIGKLVM
jgi:hypothetical protein